MDIKESNRNAQHSALSDDVMQYGTDQKDPTGVIVKPKWRGTSQDIMDMEVLGRRQVVRVR